MFSIHSCVAVLLVYMSGSIAFPGKAFIVELKCYRCLFSLRRNRERAPEVPIKPPRSQGGDDWKGDDWKGPPPGPAVD